MLLKSAGDSCFYQWKRGWQTDRLQRRRCISFEVLWEAGILEASGYDENGNIIEQERLLTTQNVAGIKAEVYQPEEIPFQETQKNGYLYQIALTLVDQNGQKVVWDDKKLRVAVSGAVC